MAVVHPVASPRRVLFEGTEDDAKVYVENNFPRVHVEPGSNYGEAGPPPDVFLEDDNNGKHAFVAGEWQDYED